MVKGYFAFDIGEFDGARLVFNFVWCIKNGYYSFGTGQGLLHVFNQIGQSGNRLIEQTEVQQEGNDVFDLQPFRVSQITAEGNNQYRT